MYAVVMLNVEIVEGVENVENVENVEVLKGLQAKGYHPQRSTTSTINNLNILKRPTKVERKTSVHSIKMENDLYFRN